MMVILWCGFLLLTQVLCHVHSLECDAKYQYDSPKDALKCCKCAPGKRMARRCTRDSETVCEPCSPDFYMDKYNTEMECKRCSQCVKEHMVYTVKCSNSSNAVCGCESGYKCSGDPCTDCEKIPTTAPPAPATATSTSTVTRALTISQDTVWITLSLCCVCILLTCFILISRITPACRWIMLASAGCSWWSEKTSTNSSQCTEDEEVPMPVQEVSGHKMWQDEV